MTGLETIEERLAHALGSARAGVAAARTALATTDDPLTQEILGEMELGSRELASRCETAMVARAGDPVSARRVARAAVRTAASMMNGYLGPAPTTAAALEYVCLAKAGEVGRWVLLGAVAEGADEPAVADLARWALALLQGQLTAARRCAEGHPDPAAGAVMAG